MFHMGWFIGRGYSVHAWNQPWSGTIGTDYMQPDIYIDLVRAMERAWRRAVRQDYFDGGVSVIVPTAVRPSSARVPAISM